MRIAAEKKRKQEEERRRKFEEDTSQLTDYLVPWFLLYLQSFARKCGSGKRRG